MHKYKGIQLVNLLEKDTVENTELVLTGSTSQSYFIRPAYSGFVSYQVSDPGTTLSGALTINLEMSNDGKNWAQATDANGDDITHSLTAGSSILEKLSDVNPAIKFRLTFASATTGTVSISTRI